MNYSIFAIMAVAMAMGDYESGPSRPAPVFTGDGDEYRKARADKAALEKAEAKRQRKAARKEAARLASQPKNRLSVAR